MKLVWNVCVLQGFSAFWIHQKKTQTGNNYIYTLWLNIRICNDNFTLFFPFNEWMFF